MKYKHAESEGWYYQIDDNGNKGQSWNKKNRPKMYAEMRAWVKVGNTIEPRYTPKELAQKEAEELEKEKTTYIGKREAEFPTQKELLVALWERVVEGRPEASNTLEISRQAIKEKYKKPF